MRQDNFRQMMDQQRAHREQQQQQELAHRQQLQAIQQAIANGHNAQNKRNRELAELIEDARCRCAGKK